jgi:diguanylate cyclase (GGDEF)-like protein
MGTALVVLGCLILSRSDHVVPLFDAGTVTSGLLFLLAAVVPATAAAPRRTRLTRRIIRWAQMYLPYPPLAAASLVLAIHAGQGGRVDRLQVVLAITVVVLVIVRQLVTLTDNARLLTRVQDGQRELHHQAFHDRLTGLANRALLTDRLGQAVAAHRRDDRPLALLFCDLDGFKAVNDQLGHAAGDDLLRLVADRLRTCVRATDTVARFGGDEFAILLEGGPDDPEAVGRRIVATLDEPFMLRGQQCRPRASVGLVVADRRDPRLSGETLLHRADAAMYAAKQTGRNRTTIRRHDPDATDTNGSPRPPVQRSALADDPAGSTLHVHDGPTDDGRTDRPAADGPAILPTVAG